MPPSARHRPSWQPLSLCRLGENRSGRKGRENFFPGEADSIPWEKLGALRVSHSPLRRSADPAGMRATRSAKGAGRNN